MTPDLLFDGHSLVFEDVCRVAVQGGSVGVADAAKERMARARSLVEKEVVVPVARSAAWKLRRVQDGVRHDLMIELMGADLGRGAACGAAIAAGELGSMIPEPI